MANFQYILLEGLPGAGKTTLLTKLHASTLGLSEIPDVGNPKTLPPEFKVDWRWIVDVECLKSSLAKYAHNDVVIQERGYLSVLACHYALEKNGLEKTYLQVEKSIANDVHNGRLTLPTLTVVATLTPEDSLHRQPGTVLSMWHNPVLLADIQSYYIRYATQPLFGEKVVCIASESLQSFIMNELTGDSR